MEFPGKVPIIRFYHQPVNWFSIRCSNLQPSGVKVKSKAVTSVDLMPAYYLIGVFFKSVQSSVHCPGIVCLHHSLHLLFDGVRLLRVRITELFFHTAGHRVLMMEQTQQMPGSGKDLCNRAFVPL